MTLAGVAIVLPTLSLLAPLGIAPLAAAAVLFVLLHYCIVARSWPTLDPSLVLALGGFVAWAAATALWSLQPERSLLGAVRVGAICLGGLALLAAARDLDAGQQQRVGRAIALGAVLAALVFIAELASDFGVSRLFVEVPDRDPIAVFNRAGSVFAVLCWPLILVTYRRWRMPGAAIVTALVLLALLSFEPWVPFVAFVAALAVFAVASRKPRVAMAALAGTVILMMLALPALPGLATRIDVGLTTVGANENSVSHRLAIWAFSTSRALEKPVTGWGMATSRAIPGGRNNVMVQGQPYFDAPAIPLHPHNALVQIWLETGLPALLISGLVVLRGLRRVSEIVAGRLEAATLMAAITALIIIANLSYGIWQGWWLCQIWLSIALTLAVAARPAPE